jgi:hypothetical protein
MTTRRPIRWTDHSAAAVNALSSAQRAQAARLLEAIAMAPTAGAPYQRTRAGWLLRIASAYDTHVVYTIVYELIGAAILVVDVQVFPWTPKHSDDPFPPDIR